MTGSELRLFRQGGREFRAHRSDNDHLMLSEWAAEPGEEWHKIREFALTLRELHRLALWVSEEGESNGASLGTSQADEDEEDRAAVELHTNELDEAVARGEAQRVDPIPDESDGSLPPPKARGAFKRPSV